MRPAEARRRRTRRCGSSDVWSRLRGLSCVGREPEVLHGIRLHDLRHLHATRLLAGGVPVPTVSGRLGHANSATTLNVYAHFLEASDGDAADVIGNLLGRDE